jgi:transcriptional regulator with XRE-family HTH domain
MREGLYFLDGDTVKSLRLAQGDTQESLAALTRQIAAEWARERPKGESRTGGISVRLINVIENNRRAVTKEKAMVLASALGVEWKTLLQSVVYPRGISYFPLDDVRKEIRDGMEKAVRDSMRSLPHKAAERMARLRKVLPELTATERATLVIKEASFRDECGEHQQALKLLVGLSESAEFATLPPRTRNWGTYHAAITLRRLGRLDDALATLKPLLGDKADPIFPPAMHQSGVVFLLKAREGDVTALEKARHALETSRERWKSERNHREGLSLRRLSEVACLEGKRGEAQLSLFDAGVIFSASGCHHDLAETRKQLEDLTLRTDAHNMRAKASRDATAPLSRPA